MPSYACDEAVRTASAVCVVFAQEILGSIVECNVASIGNTVSMRTLRNLNELELELIRIAQAPTRLTLLSRPRSLRTTGYSTTPGESTFATLDLATKGYKTRTEHF